MKYLLIIILAFVMSFSAVGSLMPGEKDLSPAQSVEVVLDASESCDSEEPNTSLDEIKHFVVRTGYSDYDSPSAFQRVAFSYSNEDNLAPKKPPQS